MITADGLNADDYPPLDVHGVLPWSVLRSDAGAWQTRKRWWRDRIPDDMTGREHVEMFRHGKSGRHHKISGGRSRFDPVLAEVLYTWYCPPGGRILDPCAGGSVRGLVAARLGYTYTGQDLSEPQVTANQAQAVTGAAWNCGDSTRTLPDGPFDYAMTCPPYHNLERYSNDPADLSAMTWEAFTTAHAAMIALTADRLRDDAFCTWVISDIRDSRGHLRGLPGLTITAFQAAGLHLVNDQILITPVGSMHRFLRRRWTPARTMTRVHQHVLTFVKGDRRKATAKINQEAQ